MPSKYRTTFFDEPREASLIKLRILEKYLTPWTSKVGSAAPGGRLCVLDCFAGRGDYLDGSPGSPRLILEHAGTARYEIGCIFVEKKKEWASRLSALCSRHSDVDSTVIHGDFRERIGDVVDLIQGRPLLMLVDPYGVKDLDYKKIGLIARSTAKCDLVVTFVDSAARRLASGYPRDIVRAIGPRTGSEDYGASFAANMASEGGFLPGGRFDIKQSFDASKKYELIVFSRSHHAYELWNNFMTSESRRQRTNYTEQQFPLEAALDGMADWAQDMDRQQDIDDAAAEIMSWARDRKEPFTRPELVQHFTVHRFASFHTSTLKNALQQLAAHGRIYAFGAGGSTDRRRWTINDATRPREIRSR
jgi:hypothetical protein